MFKVNKDTRTPLASSDVFIVNFEHISHIIPVFPFLSLNMQLPAGENSKSAILVFE